MKRIFGTFLVLGFATMLLVGCGDKKEDTPSVPAPAESAVEYKDTITLIVEQEPVTMFPYGQSGSWTENIMRLVYSSLIYRTNDERWEFTSDIAKSWEYITDSQIRFHLNDNIYFSNGDKLTAEDVKFSIELANTYSYVLFYKQIDKVEVVDPLTVDIFTFGPNPALFSNIGHPRSSIISKKHFEAVGAEGYGRNPVGTGPYMMERWETGTNMTLKARDDYWKGKPGTPTVRYLFITESPSRSIEMEAGTADVNLFPDFNDLDHMKEIGLDVISMPSLRISGVFVNIGKIPDLKIRQALSYAIDYPALVRTVYGDYATVGDGVFPNMMPGYEKNWLYTYDPEKAKQLVAESSSPDGITLEACVINATENLQIAEILQYYWRQVGIDVTIAIMTAGNTSARQNSGDYQLIPGATQYGTGDPSRATWRFDGKIPAMVGLPPEVNARWKDYWDRAATELDLTKRLAIYSEYQKEIVEWIAWIPLAHKSVIYVVSPKVEGFFGAPGGICDIWQVKVRK